MLDRRQQLAVKVGTEGSYSSSVEGAAYAKVETYDLKIEPTVEYFKRKLQRAQIGALAGVPGSRFKTITFGCDLRGSGNPATAPAIGALLKGCGFSETPSAAASFTQPGAFTSNVGAAAINPLITGTFAGARSGAIELMLTAITEDSNATFRMTFLPADGTDAEVVDVTFSDVGPETFTFSDFVLSLTLNVDPNSSTTGFRPGDRWIFQVYATSIITYKTKDSSFDSMDFAIYQDGRIQKVHSARGFVKFTNSVGKPTIPQFTFMGVIESEGDAALLSGIQYETTVPPAFMGVVTDYNGDEPECYANLEINVGNDVKGRQCAASATGYEIFRINEREVTGKIDPLAALIATVNPFERLYLGTLGNLSATFGTDAGNTIQMLGPNVQPYQLAQGNRDGEIVDDQNLMFCQPEYDGGGDYSELKIIFS